MDLFERARMIPLFSLVSHLVRLDPNSRIRFLEDPRLIFHSSEVTELRERWTSEGRIFEVRTPILGILGTDSPLASFFSESVLDDLSHDNEAILSFYDILHHRIVELLIEAERRAMPARNSRLDGNDRFTRRARAVTGAPTQSSYGFAREQMLGLGRIIGVRPRTADALNAALELALPAYSIRVDDLVVRDIPLTDEQTAILGRHAILGTSLLGGHAIGQTGLVRLHFGRTHHGELESLSPGGDLHRILRNIVESTSGLIDAELAVEVARGHEPIAQLGNERTRLGAGALLGRADDAAPLHVRIPLTSEDGLAYGPFDDAAPIQ